MTPAIEIANSADAEEILALQKLAYASEAELYDDWTIPPLTQTLPEITADFDRQVFLIVREHGRIIGSVRAEMKERLCHIGRLIVHPDCQRRGIGRALMTAIERKFPEADGYQVFTGHRSEANLAHYRSHGYAVTAEKPLSDALTLVILTKSAA